MSENISVQEKIQRLELDTPSAKKWAEAGKIEAWVHHFLLSGVGGMTNPEFSRGLNLAKRWWNGPIEVAINALSPAVGTDPGMEYVVSEKEWEIRTGALVKSMTKPLSLPPLIIEYRAGAMSVRDGNTRLGAMKHLGQPRCWVVIWYNSKADFLEHSKKLSEKDSSFRPRH